MTAQLIPLNPTSDPRGNRYADADRERCLLLWRTVARRSYTKTAELTGVAENTLRNWGKEDTWADVAKREDALAADLARAALASTVVAEVEKSFRVVTDLRDDPATPPKVRLDAATFVLSIAGIEPTSKSGVSVMPQPVDATATEPSAPPQTPEQALAHLESYKRSMRRKPA